MVTTVITHMEHSMNLRGFASVLACVASAAPLAAQATPMQSMLVGGAMGFRGEVPALCRGAGA